ncbi:MAG: GGDEF domain-containing protein [Candidatus Coproplasma sp.]
MNLEENVRKFDYFSKKNLSHSCDSLTGLLNRETIIGYVNHLIKKKTPFCLAMVDVDNFKTVNDTFGHKTGDRVLAATAEYIVEKIGEDGVVGRYGGDEFIIVLEGISEYKDIWDIGHRINMGIAAIKLEGLTGLSITVTMGISRYPLNAGSYDELLELADKALYRGKMKGRNCFIIYLESKHKDIDIKASRDKAYSSMHLCSSVFNYLTETEDIVESISSLIKHLVAYYMFDHMCIETENGLNFQVVHALAKRTGFKAVGYEQLRTLVNNNGFVQFNKIADLDDKDYGNAAVLEMKRQEISSAFYARIAVHGKEYGFIRVDMTDTVRIWQRAEMDVIIISANAIALLLHYQDKNLKDIPLQPVVTIGAES